jgi:hypothetical protein
MPSSSLDAIPRKAFVAAYLLTANASEAENAVMEAINSEMHGHFFGQSSFATYALATER